MASSIENLNKGLKLYYTRLGQTYNDTFLNYVEENGFEEEDIKDYMEGDVEECGILDFDEHEFPFMNPINDDNKRNKAIYHITHIQEHLCMIYDQYRYTNTLILTPKCNMLPLMSKIFACKFLIGRQQG